ncbi:MAG: cytochrome c3 family protein [Desulfobacterales bacterium]|nr:cytochrome c3 family protein [Desulfobacterales bacterium]
MSTTEEKEQTAGEQGGEHGPEEATHEPVKPGAWRFLIPIVAFGAGFVSLLVLGWVIFPHLLYGEKQQPVDFSHVVHQEAVDEGCESCHFFREDGSFSGIPKLENCVQCHEEPMGESSEEAKFIAEYVEPGKEIPWHVYARQPQCAFFSHAAHVKMAELECAKCHGPVGDSDHARPYQYNRLTKYSRDIWGWNIAGFKKKTADRMKMDDCAECHEESKGHKDACFVCHK